MWAVMLMIGFASGNTQPAAFVVPELLPNKWRHTAIVIADAIITVAVIIGPIAGRFSVVDVASEAAIRELDYGGGTLFAIATTLFLTGLIYTATLPPNDPKVIGTLVAGFGTMDAFALYEMFAPLKHPLTPTHVFTAGYGRSLTAPFAAAFFVTMFCYLHFSSSVPCGHDVRVCDVIRWPLFLIQSTIMLPSTPCGTGGTSVWDYRDTLLDILSS
ncbi:MFS transporter DHA2 family methylenomycin A resistance protein [Microdochium nivale]|nr:MFS transporter DHA2 family methylenomycin A resistance protein [Microdochium nivale]